MVAALGAEGNQLRITAPEVSASAQHTSAYCAVEWPTGEFKCNDTETHVCSIRMTATSYAVHNIESIHYCVCGTTHRVKSDGAETN